MGFLGRGAASPSSSAMRSAWEAVKAQWGPGEDSTEINFFVLLIPQKASIWGLIAFDGKNSEEARSTACPLPLKSEEARAAYVHARS